MVDFGNRPCGKSRANWSQVESNRFSLIWQSPNRYISIACSYFCNLSAWEFFKERKLPYVQGRVWTTDSMLRETVNLVRKRKEEGCIAVEMELAGVQAICDFYGFELYDFLVAGDVLIEGNYETDGLSAANHDLDKLFLALQIAKNMRIEGR